MTNVSNRRSMMGLYSGNTCIRSHQVRFVLSEKGILTEINNIDGSKVPEDLIALNPFASLPTLIDRELVLYDSTVIIEYLDERYPHPPLMPVSPVERAKIRLALASLEKEIVGPAIQLDLAIGTRNENAERKKLKSILNSSADMFDANKFFLNDDFTIVDCVLAPYTMEVRLFWNILSNDNKSIMEYSERGIFKRYF